MVDLSYKGKDKA